MEEEAGTGRVKLRGMREEVVVHSDLERRGAEGVWVV